jgi:hypothetical protein
VVAERAVRLILCFVNVNGRPIFHKGVEAQAKMLEIIIVCSANIWQLLRSRAFRYLSNRLDTQTD